MYDAFFEERGLIPEGRLCEVGFEDLERDPVGVVGSVYEALPIKTPYFYPALYEGGVCDRNSFLTGSTPAQTIRTKVSDTPSNANINMLESCTSR